ncbi:YjiH family protein [Senegalia massiliensis]|uniref:YjiH family protein n=1 Tax=Senegalia massiliensis TaxID=1720316 RepID=UPI001030347E|nr:nucleoside recognition domain-containing protein [Senegalia massiliensis]
MEKINLSEELDYDINQLDLNDPRVLDSISLNKSDYTSSLIKFLIISSIAILVFFIPIDGSILFGTIYNGLIDLLDRLIVINGVQVGSLLICTIILSVTGITSFIGKFFSKKGSKMYNYYEKDSIIHPFLYLAGGLFITLYFLEAIGIYDAPDIIVGASTGEMVIPGVVIGVAAIIPVGAFFIPFLTDYGAIDFFGVLLEPLMRPFFKTPGKSAVDAVASFVGSTTMGIIITGRMYKSSTYTEQESAIVATCFSAVSVGYALLVMETAGIGQYFVITYFSSFLIAFILAAIIGRIPPISKKRDIFYNGRIQTAEERKEAKIKFGTQMITTGVDRATKRAYTSNNMPKRIFESIKNAFPVLPKVITLLCSIGIIGMIVAEYTPIFDYLGYIFLPLVKILGVPDAMVAAAALPAGITEMFIPVLTIADQVAELSVKTRYFVTTVSMVQIIFLAESVVVIMTTGLPVKFKELMIVFVERTFLAMPFAAIFMHLFF